MADTDRPADDRWARRLAIGLPVVALVLVVIAANMIGTVVLANDLRSDYEELVGKAEANATTAAEGAPASAPATPPETRPEVTVQLTLSEFAVEADVDSIPAWAVVTFDVRNDGTIPHDAAIGDARTAMLDAGGTDSFTVEAPGSGELLVRCTVTGHDAAGMELALPVTGGDAGTTTADGSASDEGEIPADAATTAFASPDNADAYTGDKPPLERRDPAAPALSEGTVHDITFTVEEKVMQVAEGVWQEVWTFNGQAPGPTLRVKIGDTVNLTLRNPASSQASHSIDLHASKVAWNDEMRSIAPGEELVYSFTATHAGVFMYHCGTAPALHHIGNAMHGLIIVEPRGGVDEVDHEYVFVQHEYYLGPQGQVGDLGKMSRGGADPDMVVFNGVANQYVEEPIEVPVGETVRAWVLNAGPNADSSFHVVGTIFDTVVKEGVTLRAGNPGGWGGQAMDLAPAQGGYVEFSFAEDGLYPIVTHAFNHVGRGALGLFKAGDGGPAPGGSEG